MKRWVPTRNSPDDYMDGLFRHATAMGIYHPLSGEAQGRTKKLRDIGPGGVPNRAVRHLLRAGWALPFSTADAHTNHRR